ncbi:hypothetical protein ACIRRA_37670 [Nocardia sp. NPDC101769]|uniref:hypothetical protein n=1 Tax=Nocardia sp. NPDC101769 TaxID=3364333 RepID=UPI003824785C
MSRSTLSLSELSTMELTELLDSATPALRSALQRGTDGGSDTGIHAFNSFIDA